MRKPDFVIVGAPRCGTTALFQYLEEHPEIFGATWKEPHFFGTDTIFPRRPSLEQYLSCFDGAKDEKRIGEASTSYLFSKLAAREIKEFSPEARIIIMLRDPVETMYSVHSMVLYWRNEDIEDFEAALAAEEDRKKGLCWPSKPHIINYLFYRDVVKYTEQVRRYFDAFGRENVRVIIFDDFKEFTPNVYRGTLLFLGVDPDFQPDFRFVNPNSTFRSKLLQDFVVDPRCKRIRQRILPGWLDGAVFGRLRALNTSRKLRPSMDRELRARLQREFLPEVERLSELLGRDLTFWCTAVSTAEMGRPESAEVPRGR
jgi:hypothetical protein